MILVQLQFVIFIKVRIGRIGQVDEKKKKKFQTTTDSLTYKNGKLVENLGSFNLVDLAVNFSYVLYTEHQILFYQINLKIISSN